ncbi:FAD binding domain-containing protein [Treponema primitia]|uniref:FAD binding domain-containing protein n=1 Tax=Treponema primitia TaxID=88058 RepID=UPI0002554F9D|nr:FAD binding domain-containing protein [Treponema primitia]
MKHPDPLIPGSLDELLKLIERYSGSYIFAAGGTDCLAKLGGYMSPRYRLIDISGIDELKGISLEQDDLCIGALETMTSLSEDGRIKQYAPCLAMAAAKVGSWQIRNRATLGGNLANASPAADTPAALAALDTGVLLASLRGRRELPVDAVLTGPNRTALEPGEVITGFRIPLRQGRTSAFGKIGSRTEVSIARLNLAAAMGGEVEPRVFVGTLGTAALRCREAESALTRRGVPDPAPFCAALSRLVEKAIPGRSTLPYKISAIQALGEDVFSALWGSGTTGGSV